MKQFIRELKQYVQKHQFIAIYFKVDSKQILKGFKTEPEMILIYFNAHLVNQEENIEHRCQTHNFASFSVVKRLW